ncbi:hypothetical protein GCK72_016827 [Caenorhabditis remanei]|uniref:7TM GPCR serpentine receptor class x (Srx) domain-containing protein n=1 Tax=Caenorhabditis remanei TaxID=31234 RepID=A0A6A5G5N8_CAERE|nr:hypothetical protein GCK72_016827 [Caenorhabditis remanei]KAF1750280.1 hypothetical protein GCK72_016827 [Caenorhabditis remanei]
MLIYVSIFLSMSVMTVVCLILSCHNTFNEKYMVFVNNGIDICKKFTIYGTVWKIYLMCILKVIFDTITISKVRKIRSRQGEAKFQKKEIDFLKQSLGQAIYLVIAIACQYIVPKLTTNSVAMFIFISLNWPMIHIVDGVLTLYFNGEIRKCLTMNRKIAVPGSNSVNVVVK